MPAHHPYCARDMSVEVSEQQRQADLIVRFGEKGYRLWREARHRQSLLAPTAIGTVADTEGNRISIALGINGETIVETDFDAQGCVASKIAAATAAYWVQGRSLDEAAAIDDQAILMTVDRFPREERRHTCLAATAVREAVRRWLGANALA